MVFDDPEYGAFGINSGLGVSLIPFLVDLNRDGLVDLLIGEKNGNINYLQNIGSESLPFFDPDPNQSPNNFLLGGLNYSLIGEFEGYAAPAVYEFDGKYSLFVSTASGHIFRYNNIEQDIEGEFLEEELIFNKYSGQFLRFAMADFNGNGLFELITGNQRGGINAYYSDINLEGVYTGLEEEVIVADSKAAIRLYPNPANDWVFFDFDIDSEMQEKSKEIQLFDLSGKSLMQIQTSENRINISSWQTGIYFYRVIVDENQFSGKLIIE